MNSEQRKKVIKQYKLGMTQREIAEYHGVNRNTIRIIIKEYENKINRKKNKFMCTWVIPSVYFFYIFDIIINR